MSIAHAGAQRAATAALATTLALAAAKAAVGIATSSLSVLSQALDSVVDVVAIALVLVGVRIASRPADTSHHYGHAKAENLVAFVQTLILGGIVVAVAVEAVRRLTGPAPEVETPWFAFAVLGISAGVDILRARALASAARRERSDALLGGALNLGTDVATAVVALGSLVLVRAGFDHADAWGSLLVAGAVALAAWNLGRRSVDVLMDKAPDALAAIETAAAGAPGVSETRRVRVRGSKDRMFADVTVAARRTSSLQRAHDIAEGVEAAIARVAPGADVVVHVEPAASDEGLVERVQAAAGRTEGVHEVHNILVHAFDHEGAVHLHVTLHAKVRPGMSLVEAHRLSDEIEAAVAGELGSRVRVDSHIEPLVPTSIGTDVTSERPDLVDATRKLALEEAEVLDCHEVLVTSSRGEVSIVAHVRGRADLALDLMHEASQRIEKSIHAAYPDVGSVVIHFEPA